MDRSTVIRRSADSTRLQPTALGCGGTVTLATSWVWSANNRTTKEHGDTIWTTTPARLTRIVDAAGRIQLLRKLKGQPAVVIDHLVRGDTAHSA